MLKRRKKCIRGRKREWLKIGRNLKSGKKKYCRVNQKNVGWL
jgi:hypothetical protein